MCHLPMWCSKDFEKVTCGRKTLKSQAKVNLNKRKRIFETVMRIFIFYLILYESCGQCYDFHLDNMGF